MYSTKSFVLLKLGLSPLIINYLHTLHTELNTFISSSHSNPNQPLPSAKEILEGIFQIIGWDIKAQISHEEFNILFTEWNKAKGSSLSPSKLFDLIHKNQFLIDQIIIALRNSSSSQNDFSIHVLHFLILSYSTSLQKLVKAIETLTQAYDDFVCNNNDLGLDIRGHNVHTVEQGNLTLMNEIFRTFDQKEQGHLTLDTLFFFYIALTELHKNENILKPEDEEIFCQNLNSSFKDFLDHLKCFQGRITASQMKTYLLYNGIASKNDLNSLRKSMRNIIEMGEEINEQGFNETGGLLPDLLQMSLKKTFPYLNFSDLSQNPTDLQLFYHFILVRFYPYIHEQEYFEGLLISNKTLLAQMLFKEFKKYYGDDVFRTVQWSFDPAQTLQSLVKAYNEAANELLHLYFQCKLQGKHQNNNPSVSVRTSYFQDTPSIGRNNSIQEYTGRPSRIMLSGRNTEAYNSFREMSQFTEASEILMALPLQKEPSVASLTSLNKSSARGLSEGRTRGMNKENSSRPDSSRRTPSVGPQKKKQVNNKTVNSHKKENSMTTSSSRDLSPIANPQSLRKVLEEVDNNYAKKFLNKGPIISNRDRKILGDPEHLMKIQEFTSGQISNPSRRDSGPFEIDMSIKARSQLGTETKSAGASKPPLKSGANSTTSKHQHHHANSLLQSQTNYESFNPRYHEKQPHITETEDVSYSIPKIKEFEPHIKANPIQTTPDQSFFEEKIQSESWAKVAPKSMDMGPAKAQNRQAWQQEKSMLDSMIKRRMSQGYFEENVDENKDSQDSMSNVDNRRASMISQQSLTSVAVENNNNQKSLRNKSMMDILNKLENKMFENKAKVNEISSSHSLLKSESFRSKSSIDSKHDDGKSILDIMKDHMTKDSSNVRTNDPAEVYEDKKEFHINLQELIGESKKAPIHSDVRKASQPKVYSMSIAEHMQPAAKKENQKMSFGTSSTATPTKEAKGLMSKEGSQMKSIEKRIPLQESGNSRSLLAMKARQSSSKSPANSRSGRAMKTESFEVVMARLKKTPGNTPTKQNVKRNMVY